MTKILIELYKWEGSFFPFKISSKCGECSLNTTIIKNVIEEIKEEENISIEFKTYPWLDNWYKTILKKGFHPPIVFINGKLLKQKEVLTREELKDAIIKQYVKDYTIPKGIHIFTLPNCKYCKASKQLLKNKNYYEHNVIENSLEMQKMLKLVQGKIHPITLPQIFIDKKWIGGYEELKQYLKTYSYK